MLQSSNRKYGQKAGSACLKNLPRSLRASVESKSICRARGRRRGLLKVVLRLPCVCCGTRACTRTPAHTHKERKKRLVYTGKALWSEAYNPRIREATAGGIRKSGSMWPARWQSFSDTNDCWWNSVAHGPSLCKGPWIQLVPKMDGWMDRWTDGWMINSRQTYRQMRHQRKRLVEKDTHFNTYTHFMTQCLSSKETP